MNNNKKYFGITLDPVHIGAGGYRLGAVDNTIVREPATDVPKIPGTSLAGVIRAFADIIKKEDNNKEDNNKKFKNIDIETVFGSDNRQGILRFYDAQIIFFPVSSSKGTVWITTKDLLEYWFGEIKNTNLEKINIPEKVEDKAYALKGIDNPIPLNLGWLLLDVEQFNHRKEITIPSKMKEFLKKIVMVSDKLFSHLVNDNLEVRTSVKIDKDTGTAAEGALFTYEAISRGTILGFEINIDCRNNNNSNIEPLVENTFTYLELIGIGGLGTRGFGRVKILKQNDSQQS